MTTKRSRIRSEQKLPNNRMNRIGIHGVTSRLCVRSCGNAQYTGLGPLTPVVGGRRIFSIRNFFLKWRPRLFLTKLIITSANDMERSDTDTSTSGTEQAKTFQVSFSDRIGSLLEGQHTLHYSVGKYEWEVQNYANGDR